MISSIMIGTSYLYLSWLSFIIDRDYSDMIPSIMIGTSYLYLSWLSFIIDRDYSDMLLLKCFSIIEQSIIGSKTGQTRV